MTSGEERTEKIEGEYRNYYGSLVSTESWVISVYDCINHEARDHFLKLGIKHGLDLNTGKHQPLCGNLYPLIRYL